MDWNNINTDRDTSGLGPIEYEQSKVPSLIRKHADDVRTKTYGQEVREAQARNAEIAGLIASESKEISEETKLRQDNLETYNDQVITEMTEKDVISAPEIIQARGPYTTINQRLEAYRMSYSVKDFGAVGDGVTDDTQSTQSALEFAGASNAAVYFPDGNYLISDTVLLNGKKPVLFGSGKILLSTLNSRFLSSDKNEEVVIRGLTFDGRLYGSYENHYDEPAGIRALQLNSNKNIVTNCYFENIYGTGIHSEGIPYFVNNKFINVAGHNPTQDASGVHDNYGDAIWCGGIEGNTIIGEISNNYMKTEQRGRAGIVVEFSPNMVNIQSNHIDGYNQSIHLEECGTVLVKGNYATNNTTALVVSKALAHITDNDFSSGLQETYAYNFGVIYFYQGGAKSIIRNNKIDVTNSRTRIAIALSPTNNENVSIEENEIIGDVESSNQKGTVIFRNDITGAVSYAGSSNVKILRNKIRNGALTFSQAENFSIDDNEFYITESGLGRLLNAANIKGGVGITNNKFFLTVPLITAYVFDSFGGENTKGNNVFDGNVIYSDVDMRFFNYSTTANHQPYYVREPNYLIKSNGSKIIIKQKTKYDNSGERGVIQYMASQPNSGSWFKGDIIYNTSPSVGGVIGWVCVASGTPGTWKGFGVIEQ